MARKMSLLSRLASGDIILGDGSYNMTLEKRGYVKAGEWTTQAAAESPDAVEQLAVEFARAGGDVTQTFTFWCHQDALPEGCAFTCEEINQAACRIASRVSDSHGTIIAGGVTQCGGIQDERDKPDKAKAQEETRAAIEILVKNGIDLIICEYFHNILEMEWALEVALEFGLPVAATMCIGPEGDESGRSVGECAVRMARAGATLVGVNCLFDQFVCLDLIKAMKEALDDHKLTPYLMAQPLGYRVPDGGRCGWLDIPEFPYSVETRQITRFEARTWAREAYNLGVRYIGGCCGFEPYHIRAMAEELADVRGKLPEASAKSDHDLTIHKDLESKLSRYDRKGDLKFWMNQNPCTGRPLSTPFCCAPLHPPALVNNAVFN